MKDIYVYPDTFVLINKLNIKTSKELDEAENALVSLNIANLLINPFKIKSVFDIKKIHKINKEFYPSMDENDIIEIDKKWAKAIEATRVFK